jgi:hypothetical protein
MRRAGRLSTHEKARRPAPLMKETLSGEKQCRHIFQNHPFFFYRAYYYAWDFFKIAGEELVKPLCRFPGKSKPLL